MPVELLVGAAVGAGLVSTTVRKKVRTGVVYGLAGVLMAYDKVAAFAAEVRSKKTAAEVPANPAAAPVSAPTETAVPSKQSGAELQPANAVTH